MRFERATHEEMKARGYVGFTDDKLAHKCGLFGIPLVRAGMWAPQRAAYYAPGWAMKLMKLEDTLGSVDMVSQIVRYALLNAEPAEYASAAETAWRLGGDEGLMEFLKEVH